MKLPLHSSGMWLAAFIAMFASRGLAQDGHYPDTDPAAQAAMAAQIADMDLPPYKILTSTQTMGTGGIDYVTADSDGRRLYVPRGSQILVFNLDTLKQVGAISNVQAHGVAVDPGSGHGFCSSKPVLMWDTATLVPLASIDVQGSPDGILFEPFTHRVYVFSHRAPNATVIDSKDGTIVGTINLGGSPEQAVSDGRGHVYVDLEDKDRVAEVDANTLKVTATFDLAGQGHSPGGLAMDSKNHLLFVMCHDPQTCVVISPQGGRAVSAVPIGAGTDGGGFNPHTLEAFSSQRDGTLTIIRETGLTSAQVEQTIQTRPGAKTCTFDNKTDHIITINLEPLPAAAGTRADNGATNAAASGGDQGEARPNRRDGPGLLNIMVMGR